MITLPAELACLADVTIKDNARSFAFENVKVSAASDGSDGWAVSATDTKVAVLVCGRNVVDPGTSSCSRRPRARAGEVPE